MRGLHDMIMRMGLMDDDCTDNGLEEDDDIECYAQCSFRAGL